MTEPAIDPSINPLNLTQHGNETLFTIGMALTERDSADKGVRLLKALTELSPFTEGTDTVANAASCAAHGWARCQAQTFVNRGTIGHDWDIKTAVAAVGPEVYRRAASGQHGHGLPSVALALMCLTVTPLVRDRQLKAETEPTPETVGRSSFHQDMAKVVKRMAHQSKVNVPALWAKAMRIKDAAQVEVDKAGIEADPFAYGRLDEARTYLRTIEVANEMLELNSLNPYTTDEKAS